VNQKLSGPMLAPQSGAPPRQLVVLLHGYGSDGNDLIALGRQWAPLLPEALFVAPHAPERCGSLSAGFQWFDIALEGDRLASRQAGVVSARPVLLQFLSDLWSQTGRRPQDTFLVGFSQGAMVALHVGLSLPEPLLGIVAFSGAFLPVDDFADGGYARPPVCLVHGDMDNVVDAARSVEAAAALRGQGIPVEHYVSRGSAHGIAPDGLDFATRFLLARVAAAN
jgi:phospholipase/carboxylesterase